MMPVSGVGAGAVRPLAAEKAAPGVREPGEEDRLRKPVMDEYIPEEPQEPSGRYWVERDGDGQPRICFDSPERTADAPEGAPGAEKPEQDKGAEQEERCVCDTGKVDREIERLKKKRRELEQRLNTKTDEAKIKDLERQLAQVERELKQKDSDTYRRQHAAFTRLS